MPRSLGLALLIAFLLAPVAWAAPVPQPDARSEAKKLQGTWRGYFVDENGRPDSSDVAQVVLVVEKDRVTITYVVPFGPAEIAELTYKGTFKADPARKPSGIDITLTEAEGKQCDGKELHGIYELRKDTLKWCTSEVGDPRGPRRLATTAENKQMLFEFQRSTPDKPR